MKLEKKIVTADDGCNSDGMARRRYHIPITEEWIALGSLHGDDLRQVDVITFAMPPCHLLLLLNFRLLFRL